MNENEIIETLIQNKKKGTAFGFLPEEVQEWIKGNYEKCAILTKKGVWDKAQKYIVSKDDIAPSDVYIMLFCFKKQNEWVEFNIGKDGYFSIDGCSYHWSQVSLFLTSNPEYTSFGGYQYAGRNDWYTEPRVFCDDDGSDLYLDQYDDSDNCKPAIPIKIRFWRKTMANKIVNKTCPECGKVFRTRDAEKIYCSLPCKQEAKERKLIIKTKGPNKETEEMTESIKSSIEAKIKASEEALAKSEREQLQLKARVETLYEIYNNLRENAAA